MRAKCLFRNQLRNNRKGHLPGVNPKLRSGKSEAAMDLCFDGKRLLGLGLVSGLEFVGVTL